MLNVSILDTLLLSWPSGNVCVLFSGADGEPLQEEDYFLSNPYHLVRWWMWHYVVDWYMGITSSSITHTCILFPEHFTNFLDPSYVMCIYPCSKKLEDLLQLSNMLMKYTFIWLIFISCGFSHLKCSKNLLKRRTEGRIVRFKLYTLYFIPFCFNCLCMIFLPYQLSHMTWRNTVTQK